MDSLTSVSKGVFVFQKELKKKKSKKQKNDEESSLFNKHFIVEPWYVAYKTSWKKVDNKLKDLTLQTYNTVLTNIVNYIKECYDNKEIDLYENVVPTATLLTGVNQPDHCVQFTALTDKLRSEVTPHIATVYSQDSPNVKNIVENIVWQFVNDQNELDVSMLSDDLELSPNRPKPTKFRKSHCTMSYLKSWYETLYNKGESPSKTKKSPTKKKRTLRAGNNSLVIVVPDFERFNSDVLQDLILIVSAYIAILPIVLVFGVATSVSALHKSFPYHVSSKLMIRVFQSHSSTSYLNQVLEEIFLTENCPFHVSGKAFELLTDVFLFYDFSVTGFVQGIKYCMMEHYYANNIKALCCPKEEVSEAIAKLNSENLEQVRRLPSFRPYVESQDARKRIDLLEDDEFLRKSLSIILSDYHEYIRNFHVVLRILLAFVKELPRSPLGKQLREIYSLCTSKSLTETTEYKECIQMVSFQSKNELLENLKSAIKTLNHSSSQRNLRTKSGLYSPLKSSPSKLNSPRKTRERAKSTVDSITMELTGFLHQIDAASLQANSRKDDTEDMELENQNHVKLNRQELKEKLFKAMKEDKVQSEFEIVRASFVAHLTQLFKQHLQPPTTQALHELMVFSDVASVRKQIIGSPRGAIHTALNNPQVYLQCECCSLPSSDAILPTLPDVCIAYKLHRECGKLINLYDWLQAFLTVVDPVDPDESEDERRVVKPIMQARFTRAVAELQFLGFIKPSKRKTDHVMRLTW